MQERNDPVYHVLNGKIAERGIKKGFIAQTLGITQKAFFNKLTGKSQFTWSEACMLQERFFPDISKETLFALPQNESKEKGEN